MHRILDHPLIHQRLARLRQTETPTPEFRQLLSSIASLMVPEVTASLSTRPVTIQTPLEEMSARELQRPIILVPIMRAGLAMLEGFHPLMPEATVAHVGVARDEATLEPHSYFWKCPPRLSESEVIVVDPMLATAGSAIWTIDELKRQGARHLHMACIVAAPEGIDAFEKAHPEVPLTCATADRQLNSDGYIVPGLGDAGDRAFGTA